MNVRKVLLKSGAGLGGAALLAGAMWLHSTVPGIKAGQLDPIRDGGTVGTEVANDHFSVVVEKVEAARSLAPLLSLGDPPPVGTDGVYLIVRFRATTHHEPLQLRLAELETPGGYTFGPDPRPGTAGPAGGRPTFQPLIWTSTALVFELPEKRLEGARLVLGAGGLLPQLSAAAEIDLGITKERADELVRDAVDGYDFKAGDS